MQRLRSIGDIEKVDVLCRQIPFGPRNRQNTPRMEDETAHLNPRLSKSLPVTSTSPSPSTLRLYTEPSAHAARSAGGLVASLPDTLQAFQRATG